MYYAKIKTSGVKTRRYVLLINYFFLHCYQLAGRALACFDYPCFVVAFVVGYCVDEEAADLLYFVVTPAHPGFGKEVAAICFVG